MSTRSNIGIINRDGSVEMIYCHSDGYPCYNGRLLLEHYSNEDKVREILAQGDMSSLGPVIGEKVDFEDYTAEQCRFYARDRGEKGVESRKKLTVKSALASMEEYLYLWDCKTNSWIFSVHGESFSPLTPAACL